MSTEKDNPETERDLLLERFQQACSFITTVVLEKDPLFAEFAERFLWLFYYSGYRQVTWMIEACLDPDLLRSLFRYHWDNNLDDLPSGEVLMRAVPLTFHDVLDLPRETVTDHLEECFRDALEELRTSQHNQGEKEGASLPQKAQQKSKPGKPADPKIQKRGEIVRKHIYKKSDFLDEEKKQALLREFEENEIPPPRNQDGYLRYPGMTWQKIMSQSAKWTNVVDNILNRDRFPKKKKITTE